MCTCESYRSLVHVVIKNLIHENAPIMYFDPLRALFTLNRLLNRVRQRIKKKSKNGSNGNPTIPAITYDKNGAYVEEVQCKGSAEVYDNMQNSAAANINDCPVYETI